VKDLTADRGGSTAIEYALIASVISIAIVTALTTVGTTLSRFFASINFGP
jgi:pilus assembly protein Flp/PilA